MPHRKVLSDLVTSAGSAKAHFEVWWALESEAKPALVDTMQAHSDFFRASSDAHYNAFFTYLAHLYDKRRDTSSIKNYLKLATDIISAERHHAHSLEHHALLARATPLVEVRHNTVAHISAKLTERDVFTPLSIRWEEIRAVVYDSAVFVAKLAGTSDLGSIGICRDRRLIDATLKVIRVLANNGSGSGPELRIGVRSRVVAFSLVTPLSGVTRSMLKLGAAVLNRVRSEMRSFHLVLGSGDFLDLGGDAV